MLAGVILFYGIAFGSDRTPVTPEDFAVYADECYADKGLALVQRKEAMDKIVAAADKFGDNYGIKWRAAQAIYVYADSLYYGFQMNNYGKALSKKDITTVDDVIDYSQDLDSEQSKTLLELGTLGRKYADRAVELNPQGVEGHYYDAMSISIYAFGKSIVKALLEGLGPKYEEHLDAALKINKDYLDGSIFIAYGRYWYKLPWPKRSITKSFKYLEPGLAYNSQNIITLDFLGDSYYKDGQKQEAKKCWEGVLSSDKKTYRSENTKKLVEAKLKFFGH